MTREPPKIAVVGNGPPALWAALSAVDDGAHVALLCDAAPWRRSPFMEGLALDDETAAARVLTDDEIRRVAEMGMRIEAHYGAPQDVEWAFVGDELFVVQSRPITTLAALAKRAEVTVVSPLAWFPGASWLGERHRAGKLATVPHEGVVDGELPVVEAALEDRAHLALGSNLGDREGHLLQATEMLSRLPDTALLRVSSVYDTEPVGEVDQPEFLNAVALLETQLTARQLLWNLLLIERRLGRVRSQKWGPRTIDLDLLLHGDLVVDEADLQVPHPEMHRRAFVLVPLLELEPNLTHPVTGEGFAQHLSRLKTRPPVKRGTRLWN